MNGMEETMGTLIKESGEIRLLRKGLDAGLAKAVAVLEETQMKFVIIIINFFTNCFPSRFSNNCYHYYHYWCYYPDWLMRGKLVKYCWSKDVEKSKVLNHFR